MPPYQFQNQFQMPNAMYQKQFSPYGQPQPERFEVVVVSTIEEAKNAIVSPLYKYLFVNFSTGEIYYKCMNNSGLSDFVVYTPSEQSGRTDPLVEINQRLGKIEDALKGVKNEPVPNYAESAGTGAESFQSENERNAQTESLCT